jgi:nucleotide-binding universal stress UspA family protein
MKTIVVGYESSEAADRALVRAAEVAEAFSARLVVVSVAGSPRVPVRTSPLEAGPELVATGVAGPIPVEVPAPPEGHPVPEPKRLAQHELERARMSLAGRRLEAEYMAEIGDPAGRLLEVADQRDADLIVVGSPERGFLDRLLGRAVDEAVARRTHRDVLLVH